jgi:hypothetical protein
MTGEIANVDERHFRAENRRGPLDIGSHANARRRKIDREKNVLEHFVVVAPMRRRPQPSQLSFECLELNPARIAELSQRVLALPRANLYLFGCQIRLRIRRQNAL